MAGEAASELVFLGYLLSELGASLTVDIDVTLLRNAIEEALLSQL